MLGADVLVTTRGRSGAIRTVVTCCICAAKCFGNPTGWLALLPDEADFEPAVCCSLACEQEVRVLDRRVNWTVMPLSVLMVGLAEMYAKTMLLCPICRSPSAVSVTEALLNGEPQRTVGIKYGWSKGSVLRHSQHVLVGRSS